MQACKENVVGVSGSRDGASLASRTHFRMGQSCETRTHGRRMSVVFGARR